MVTWFTGRTCAELLRPGGQAARSAYLDMTTSGGGWTNLDVATHRVEVVR